MHMPRVTSDMITSIREQTIRSDLSDTEPYCSKIMDEMKDENPELHEAIMSSVRVLSQRLGLDLSDRSDYVKIINILNLAASVYQSIKQQMIVDELELQECNE